MFPSDLTPDDILRARTKALQEEAMLKAMQEGPAASTTNETPAELRAAMGDIAAQFAAQEGRSANREAALLELCAGLFDERLAEAEPQRAQAVLQAAASLELEAKGRDIPGSLQAEAVRAGLLGDWRLVFTDSAPALKGGVSGLGGLPFCSSVAVLQRLSEGSPAAQCIEVVGLPLGVRNAVILKGSWMVDEDAMLLCEYSSSEVAGGSMPEGMATAQRTVVTATSHLGTRLRLERSQSGSLFVWERQTVPIDQTAQALVTG